MSGITTDTFMDGAHPRFSASKPTFLYRQCVGQVRDNFFYEKITFNAPGLKLKGPLRAYRNRIIQFRPAYKQSVIFKVWMVIHSNQTNRLYM